MLQQLAAAGVVRGCRQKVQFGDLADLHVGALFFKKKLMQIFENFQQTNIVGHRRGPETELDGCVVVFVFGRLRRRRIGRANAHLRLAFGPAVRARTPKRITQTKSVFTLITGNDLT